MGRRKRKEKKSKKGIDQAKYGCMTLVWILVGNCMIFVHKLLGYGVLGFSLENKLVPFSRVLLVMHHNSRFKRSLVENP